MGRNGDPQGDDYGLPRIDIVVPDDARELDRDVIAYRREQRQRRRRARWQRVVRPFTRYGMAAPIIAAAVLIAVVSGTLLTVFGPHSSPRPTSAPPSTQRVTARSGQVGGPLPNAQVTVDGKPAALLDQRPAVIIIVPPDCRCDPTVTSLARQAGQRRIGAYLTAGPTIGATATAQPSAGTTPSAPASTGKSPSTQPSAGQSPSAGAPKPTSLRALAKKSAARVIEDKAGVLLSTYKPKGLTALFVHTDGVVGWVIRQPRADQRFDAQLEPLQRPGQAG